MLEGSNKWLRTGNMLNLEVRKPVSEGDIWACEKIWIQKFRQRESKCKVLKWEQAWNGWTQTSIGKNEAGTTACSREKRKTNLEEITQPFKLIQQNFQFCYCRNHQANITIFIASPLQLSTLLSP